VGKKLVKNLHNNVGQVDPELGKKGNFTVKEFVQDYFEIPWDSKHRRTDTSSTLFQAIQNVQTDVL